MNTIQFELRGGEDDFIQLIQLLKATNCVYTGSEAQEVVSAGMVLRNGVIETRKRAKIVRGDIIEFDGNRIEVL
ncbi:MAG: RNA-binding S4 domain-containing protein [Bacteroidales bacterium]|nr:RNA-binding S4 domain-containing protein [Candidatus Colicola faecequi]